MLVTDYLSKDFVPPKLNQMVAHGLKLVHDYNLTHIPVFKGLDFVGNLSHEILEEFPPETYLSELLEYIFPFHLDANSSLLEAIQQFNNQSTNILVVLDSQNHYSGMLLMDDIISGLSSMPFISEPGSIIIVEIPQKQFSVSEVAKIAESNNARIIGLFVTGYKEDKIQITLKLIADSLASVSETFERFNYTVLHKFFEDEKEDLMKDRFDMLMKYLDV